jgi:hypoxanthine phosphoribosyltransferase
MLIYEEGYMEKLFLEFDDERNDAIKLAHRIWKDGFAPDIIYVSLRGGAYIGNVISEYFKIVLKNEHPVYYAAVVVHSYTDVAEQEKIYVEGWTYSPEHLRIGDKVLICDDVFDTGRTVNFLVPIIMDKGIPRHDIKVAVHDYKFNPEVNGKLPIQPDYYCRKYDANEAGETPWLHYMSHELIGLRPNELEDHYYKKDPSLREALSVLEEARRKD